MIVITVTLATSRRIQPGALAEWGCLNIAMSKTVSRAYLFKGGRTPLSPLKLRWGPLWEVPVEVEKWARAYTRHRFYNMALGPQFGIPLKIGPPGANVGRPGP